MGARLSAEATEALIGLGASDHIVPELVEEAHVEGGGRGGDFRRDEFNLRAMGAGKDESRS
jgi:hypothetical protein